MTLIIRGDSLDLVQQHTELIDLCVTDPPYAFGGNGDEHELSATVAIVLRETAARLAEGRWMLIFCASSWRSTMYMAEAVRGILRPVRIGHWLKPVARTRAKTTGWQWATVHVLACCKGSSIEISSSSTLDHIVEAPIRNGKRAQLPPSVASWAVSPFAVSGGLFLDPFAGSGALCEAAERSGMRSVGFEKQCE